LSLSPNAFIGNDALLSGINNNSVHKVKIDKTNKKHRHPSMLVAGVQ